MDASSPPLPHQGPRVSALLNGQFAHKSHNTANLPNIGENEVITRAPRDCDKSNPLKRDDVNKSYRNIGLSGADGAAWCHRHPTEV